MIVKFLIWVTCSLSSGHIIFILLFLYDRPVRELRFFAPTVLSTFCGRVMFSWRRPVWTSPLRFLDVLFERALDWHVFLAQRLMLWFTVTKRHYGFCGWAYSFLFPFGRLYMRYKLHDILGFSHAASWGFLADSPENGRFNVWWFLRLSERKVSRLPHGTPMRCCLNQWTDVTWISIQIYVLLHSIWYMTILGIKLFFSSLPIWLLIAPPVATIRLFSAVSAAFPHEVRVVVSSHLTLRSITLTLSCGCFEASHRDYGTYIFCIQFSAVQGIGDELLCMKLKRILTDCIHHVIRTWFYDDLVSGILSVIKEGLLRIQR